MARSSLTAWHGVLVALALIAVLGVVATGCSTAPTSTARPQADPQAIPPLVLHREGFTNRIEAAQPGNYYLMSIAKPDLRGPIVHPRPSDSAAFALSVARDSVLPTTTTTANPSLPTTSPSEVAEEAVTVRGKPGRLWGVGDPRSGGPSSRKVLRGCVQWRESGAAIAQLCLGENNVYVKEEADDPDSRTVLTDTANQLVVPSGDEWFTLQKGTPVFSSPRSTPFYTSSMSGTTISVGQHGEGVQAVDEYVTLPGAAADDFQVRIVLRPRFHPQQDPKPAGVVEEPRVAPPGTGSVPPPLPRHASMTRYEVPSTERNILYQTTVQVLYPPERKTEARTLLDSLRVANDDEIRTLLAAPVDPVVAALHTPPFRMTKRVA